MALLLIVFAVIYFIFAFMGFAFMFFCIAVGAGAWSFSSLIGILWNIAAGIFLISKQSKAVFPQEYSGQNMPAVGIIEGQFGAYQGKRCEIYAGTTYKIGRESGCDIQINHPKVSRIHCTVCKLPSGNYRITDYSSNGTFYENRRLVYE